MIKIAKLIIGKESTKKKKTVNKNNDKNKRPEYEKSDAVISAENALKEWENNKPDEYKSKYSSNIDRILSDILNREDFTYNMNADPMYQQYREKYIENGKKAMMDTLGQATALTGGYLNSYAATVGNQAYDEYLNEINDIALDLRDRAYAQYVDEGDKLLEDITVLRSLDGDDYDRYWDKVQLYYKDGEYLVDKLVSMSDAEFEAFLAQVDAWENDRDYAFKREQEENDKREFADEMKLKKEQEENDEKEFAAELDFRKQQEDNDRQEFSDEMNLKREQEANDKNEFSEEMAFKKAEAEREQANSDRDYAFEVKKAQDSAGSDKKGNGSSSGNSNSNKGSSSKGSSSKGSSSKGSSSKGSSSKDSSSSKTKGESTTKNAPKSYQEFYDRTGISSILTESEFYASASIREKYSTYQKYLEEMYERFG